MISRGDCLLRFGNRPDIGSFFICQSAKLCVLFNYYKDVNVTRLPFSDRYRKTFSNFFLYLQCNSYLKAMMYFIFSLIF